jgi:trans-aconitate methyltransferase
MWSEIDFNNKSVLDVGCGFGEMARFLKKRYKNVSYLGIDFLPEFVSRARKLHPEYKFKVGNYFTGPLREKFDVVIASGVLNSNVNGNIEYRKKAIKIMYEHAKQVLAFNMLGSHPQPLNNSKSNVWYADSLEILDYCLTLTRRVVLKTNYHPKDFTILMYRLDKKTLNRR